LLCDLGDCGALPGIEGTYQNLRTVAAGAALGLAGALAFARLLKTILYGLPPTDPIAIAASTLILMTTALLAVWAPAQRAATIDPALTLRQDG